MIVKSVKSEEAPRAEEGGYVNMPRADFEALCAERDALLVWVAAQQSLAPRRLTISNFMRYRGRPEWTWSEYEAIVRGWTARGQALVEGAKP